jgi:glucose-6-phosphate isomerase
MPLITLNTEHAFTTAEDINSISKELYAAREELNGMKGRGSDFLGWLGLPSAIKQEEIISIEHTAKKLRENSEVIVVIGIGGSYLGARAVIEALSGSFDNIINKSPKIIFAGQNISEDYHAGLLKILDKTEYSIIVISKSGTTTEPAIAFRLLKKHIEAKYGKEKASKRIIAITDKQKGALKKLAGKEGYKTFDIPDDVGGRFSVLTPVGLLPIACAGYNIHALLDGAKQMQEYLSGESDINKNIAECYASVRSILYRRGKVIEILVSYEPQMQYFIEWWKQLYGESEGKDGKGIFTAGVNFTTDLHSMGQMIQDGMRNIFETVISVENPRSELRVPGDNENLDELNYIAGKRLSEINHKAEEGTRMAHVDGGVPNIRIIMPELNEAYLGQLIYFFEKACALSGYMLGVNPFDQPGVEAYKKNMFTLLGKK